MSKIFHKIMITASQKRTNPILNAHEVVCSSEVGLSKRNIRKQIRPFSSRVSGDLFL
jgi:hypothetical protein